MSFWRSLGIEPTADPVAIKKAYAAKLKKTRPDDDAAAYQALREAYESALLHAREYAQGPAEPASAAHAPHGEPPPPPGPAAARDSDTHPPAAAPGDAPLAQELGYVPPRVLAQETWAYLQSAGPDALDAGWPRLAYELDRLPLLERREASNWFAQFVIDAPQVPLQFANALSAHFAWETDFRAEQWLGAPRAMAVKTRLSALRSGFHADAAFRERYAEVGFYARLIGHIAAWRLYLFAMLAPGRLARLWKELAPRQRYELGVPPPPLHNLADRALGAGGIFRTALVLLLASVLTVIPPPVTAHEQVPWGIRVLNVLLLGCGCVFLSLLAHGVSLHVKARLHAPLVAAMDRFVPRLSGKPWLAFASLACSAVGAVVLGIAESNALLGLLADDSSEALMFAAAIFLVTVAALLLPWPPAEAAQAFPALALLCMVAAAGLPWLDQWPVAAAAAGFTWLIACRIAYGLYGQAIEQAWHRYRMGAAQARSERRLSMQRSLVLPLTVASWTLGLPYRLMAFANAQSARQVAAVILLSFLALPPAYRAWQIPVTAFTWAVLALLGRIAIANAVTALAPWQQAAAWRGWAVLATLALAVGWACAYWEWAAEIDAWCGWMPAASLGESLLRKSLLGLWGPLFLLLLVNARLGRDHGSSA